MTRDRAHAPTQSQVVGLRVAETLKGGFAKAQAAALYGQASSRHVWISADLHWPFRHECVLAIMPALSDANSDAKSARRRGLWLSTNDRRSLRALLA